MVKCTNARLLKQCITYVVIVANKSLLEQANSSIEKVALMFVAIAIKKDLLKHKVPLGNVIKNLMPVLVTSCN